MSEENRSARVLRFGVFEMDLRAGELRKSGVLVRLEPQPYKVLTLLAARPGELVSQEELRQHIWGDNTFVDYEQGLRFAIKKIRAALGDRSESPRYIETLPRRGYRFVAGVEVVESPPAELTASSTPVTIASPSAETTRKQILFRGRWIVVGGMLAILLALFGLNVHGVRARLLKALGAGRYAPAPNIHSLVVLPLENLSGDEHQEYFADGMTEELITDLSQISTLRVISRTSAMAYKGSKETLPEIARELHVDAVVEGSVEKEGNRVRITAQLIDAASDRNLWAETYDSDLRNVLDLQNQVAEAVAEKIQLRLTPQERQRIASAPISPQAYDDYELGEYHLHQGGIVNLHKALNHFNRAIEMWPNYSNAYLGVAESYTHMTPGFVPPSTSMPKARDAVMKALSIDNNLAGAHAMLGVIRLVYDWQWPQAEKEIKRALQLDANSAVAHESYAAFYAAQSQSEDAAREMRQAQELDPLSRGSSGVAARCWILYMAHKYDMSANEVAKDLEVNPNFGFGHAVLGLIALDRGHRNLALTEAREGVKLQSNPFALEILGIIEARLGMRTEALGVIRALNRRAQNEYVCLYEVGAIYAALGDRNSAFKYLNKACDDRDSCMIWLESDRRLRNLHSDARFRDLVRKVGFPPSSSGQPISANRRITSGPTSRATSHGQPSSLRGPLSLRENPPSERHCL